MSTLHSIDDRLDRAFGARRQDEATAQWRRNWPGRATRRVTAAGAPEEAVPVMSGFASVMGLWLTGRARRLAG